MRTLIINIKQLVGTTQISKQLRGAELRKLEVIEDAFLLVEDGRIASFGKMYELDLLLSDLPANTIDANGKIVLPTWCDSHTHTVFAGSRENEFVDKINGLSYAEIAAKGGGILNSAAKLANASEEDLYHQAKQRLVELQRLGTGAIEIKSGYGLSTDAEIKMLRVIKQLTKDFEMPIRATFLAAHTFPAKYKENHQAYIDEIINEMMPIVEREKLADYVDVFCEQGFFSPEQTKRICNAGRSIGLVPKLHTNQLHSIGGIEAGIEVDALSLDHLETMTQKDVELMGSAKACATLLPTAAFFLRMPYQPARSLMDAGAAVTLASDFNPGSSPSGNMNFVASLSCIQMKMLPEEVINAATINGAYAMQLEKSVGSIEVGKMANIILTKQIPSYTYLFYSFGSNNIEQVMINGKWVRMY